MNDFGDLLGTPYAPVSKIAPIKSPHLITMTILVPKLQYFISVKTLSVDCITWNSQNVNLMQYYH